MELESRLKNLTIGDAEMIDEAIKETKKQFSALVVDDDSTIRVIHKMMLNHLGVKVQLAVDGQQAVDLHRLGTSFDLILMDKDMPVMDGIQATKELRAMGVTSVIVGVTSHAYGTEKIEFMEAGLNDCIEKPLTVEKITPFLPVAVHNNNNDN